MNDRLLIDAKEIGDYRIKIYYDIDAMCPCINWDMAACFLWESDRIHRLSDVCHWKEVFGKHVDNHYFLEDALHQLISDHVKWKDLLNYFKKGKIDGYRMRYDNSAKMWYLEWYNNSRNSYQESMSIEPSDLYTYDYTDEFIEDLDTAELLQILTDLGKDIFVKEWTTSGYSQGDYVEGVAFCTKERYAKMVNTDTTDWKTKINELIDSEVEEIGMWMWGDVKGYVLEKKVPYTKQYHDDDREDEEDFDWEETGSCWGYYMETDELIEEVISEYGLNKAA